jgi:hypothetical protein
MSDLLLGGLFVAVTFTPILLGRILRARACALVSKAGSRGL